MPSPTRNKPLLCVPCALLCLFGAVSAARAGDPEGPPSAPRVTISGLLDWYYQADFNHPPAGSAVGGRSFDVKADAFSFSLAEINAVIAPAAGRPVGFTVTGTFGKTADLVHATEPGGANTYKYLQQAYATYATPGARPLTIDFGKFVTMMGYEVIESPANDNYSRSLLFTYAIPLYHAGLRVTYPLTPALTGQLHLVNGWNNVEEDNGGKSIGAQLNWKPSGRLNVVLNWMGGDEGSSTANGAGTYGGIGFPRPGVLNTQTLDLVAVYTPASRLKLGLNVDYASAARKGAAGGHWSGEALYARYQMTSAAAVALRAEHFEDTDGLRTGAAQNLGSLTATFEYAVGSNLLHRLEYRHDSAGTALFASGGGGGRRQDTLTFSQVVKF